MADRAEKREIAAGVPARERGPLPHPDVLKGYPKEIRDELIRMVAEQAMHRQRCELYRLQTERFGVLCGLLIALAGLVTAVCITLKGNAWAGALIGSVDIAGLVGVFVYGTRLGRQAREAPRLPK